jgi:hypothetical protein
MANIEERIAALETKAQTREGQEAANRSTQAGGRIKAKRSQDTRRKILVGAAILAKVERGEWPQDKLLAMLDASLTRADDRALFDLPTTSTPDTETKV